MKKLLIGILLLLAVGGVAYFYNNASAPEEDVTTTRVGWEIYSDASTGFSIEYPGGWRKLVTKSGVGFGPKEILEDTLIGVTLYDKSEKSVDQVIDGIGNQFSDREQTRSTVGFNNLTAEKIITTTNQWEGWYLVVIIVESDDTLYAISNGATTDAAKNELINARTGGDYNITFEDFYTSFRLIDS